MGQVFFFPRDAGFPDARAAFPPPLDGLTAGLAEAPAPRAAAFPPPFLLRVPAAPNAFDQLAAYLSFDPLRTIVISGNSK